MLDILAVHGDYKAAGAVGQFEGYGSVFNNVDSGGDIILPGAFAESLASGRKVKMLYQHDPFEVIGVWGEISEDEHGLRVSGRLVMDVRAGAEVYALLKAGAIDGLSIGYRTVEATARPDGGRMIAKAELWEVSVVTFPMNQLAMVDRVKAAAMSERELERKLTRDAGLSHSVARALLSGGYKEVRGLRDEGADLDDLALGLVARRMMIHRL